MTADSTDGGTPATSVLGGRYRLGDKLGQGGMGVVYRATQVSLDRPVAIKVLQPALAQNLDAVARFRAEAERAGRLAHPHIVQILDFGRESDGTAWIAMELLSGRPLSSRLAEGLLAEDEVVRVALETLSALEAAHGASLVHRDLKPDNLFLTDVPGLGAAVKVLDFGIAKLLDTEDAGKLTATGMLVGTPLYMSPEQARGADVDGRADLYSLGCVLYEALAGRPPIAAQNYNALLFAILSEQPAPLASLRPRVTPALAAIVHRAIEKRAEDRFQSAREMAEALRALSPSRSIPPGRGEADSIAHAATLATPRPSGPAAPPGPASPIGTAETLATPGPATPRSEVPPTPPIGGTTAAPPAPPAERRATPRWAPWVLVALGVFALDRLVSNAPDPPGSTEAAPTPSEPPAAREVAPSTSPPPASATATATAMTPMDLTPSDRAEPSREVASVAASARVVSTTSTHTRPTSQARSEPAPAGAAEPERGVAPGEPPRTRDRARRPAAPRLARVTPNYYDYVGMESSGALREPIVARGGWTECWPAGVPAPDSDRGRMFSLTISPEGRVAAVEADGRQPVAFGECAVARLREIQFPPPIRGTTAHVRVGFGVFPAPREDDAR